MKKAVKEHKLELNKITIYRLGDSGMLKARGGLPYTEGDCDDTTDIVSYSVIISQCICQSSPPPTREDPVCTPIKPIPVGDLVVVVG